MAEENGLSEKLKRLRTQRKAAQGQAKLRASISKERTLLSKAKPSAFQRVKSGAKQLGTGFSVVQRATSGFQREARASPFAKMGQFNGSQKKKQKGKSSLGFGGF